MGTIQIQNIEGIENINEAATAAMNATLSTLVAEGLLDRTTAQKFSEEHVGLMVTTHTMWARFRKAVGIEEGMGMFQVVKLSR